MGNTGSSSGRGQHDDTVDFGLLTPQGVYTGPRDWNHTIVSQLICERKLAPFYRPLEDYEEGWDEEQILANRKDPPDSEVGQIEGSTRSDSVGSSHSRAGHQKRPSTVKDNQRCAEACVYRGAVECPICFLYYPPNINYSRCCEQPICTECFVQIKRADPTPTHLVSEPACCPYCTQENFGIVYTPPTWRAGIGSEGSTPPSWPESPKGASGSSLESPPVAAMKRRRKSFGHDSPEVVTTDQIRPDWEAKLATVRAAVARRANRRIIMRQVGDRLIPVGITSGRVHALPEGEGQGDMSDATGGGLGSRRSRRRQAPQDFNQFLGSVGMAGQDIEELMVMEAMRLSLIEHEEQQRKEREQKEKDAKKQGQSSSEAPVGESSSQTTILPAPSPSAGLLSGGQSGTDSLSSSRRPTPVPPVSTTSTTTLAPSTRPVVNGTLARALEGLEGYPGRSATPPSTGSVPQPSQGLSDSSSSWRSRRTSPPPFSTLSAAINAATSTASAVVGSRSVSTQIPSPERSVIGAKTSTSAAGTTEEGGSSGYPGPSTLSAPRMLPHANSFASSMASEASTTPGSYEVLPSSDEETEVMAHEPLLGSALPVSTTPPAGRAYP
ncbi:hypothetical protein JAAARDRAFT_32975 [Jaapia argillacea MUCL 33604]|uniref:RING-type domain-containing protein n=1 Tax=Jaapia argillacea MUCL 33604 TaxID=933084 RepID=A0A067PZZ7_9AGAM|nr:hypothetical protein JAAARDRAFT_32975 [Jaapia argillacea MUCL 33604]